MKILLTGASGQLGKELSKNVPDNINLIKLFRKDLDLSNAEECFKLVKEIKPDWVINAGAYTNVEKAEEEKQLALKINAEAPKAFAKALNITGGNLLQISTDYLFDGLQKEPYRTNQMATPINYYGLTKSKGEENIKNILIKKQGFILRTSRVIGPEGKNFLTTMIDLHNQKKVLHVVQDEFSCSSNTYDLSRVCWEIVERSNYELFNIPSIMHWCDIGVASWYDLAKTIGETALEIGIISKSAKVMPINSDKYPTKAKRPKYSILDCTPTQDFINLPPRHWKETIYTILNQMTSNYKK